ncbi:hypothetical protein [Flagellimonas marinaquae]
MKDNAITCARTTFLHWLQGTMEDGTDIIPRPPTAERKTKEESSKEKKHETGEFIPANEMGIHIIVRIIIWDVSTRCLVVADLALLTSQM